MRRALTAAVLALLIGAVAPSIAQAGTYSVWVCADGSNRPLSAGDWSPRTVGSQSLTSTTCGANLTGGTAGNLQAVAGAGPNNPDGANAVWTVKATTGTKLGGLDVWWTNGASAQAPGRIEIYAGPKSLYARDAGSFGNVATPFADGNRQTFRDFSADTVELVAWCTSTCTRDARAIASFYNAYRVRVIVSDDSSPTGEVTGSTDGAAVTGPLELQARASDAGAGVRDLQLVVDGAVVDSKAAGGTCSDIDPATGDDRDYALLKPCPSQLPASSDAPASFVVTPAMFATAGSHTIAVVAHDAAGNAGTLLSHTVYVTPALLDGAPPPSRYDAARNLFFNPDANLAAALPNGLNAGPANVTLAFVTRGVARVKGKLRRVTRLSRRRTVGYYATARMRGRVTTAAGVPIVQARVYRATSVAGGPWELATKPLITSKTGRVSFLMPARSPSRRVQLVYFPNTAANDSSRSPARLLKVRAPVSLSLNRRSMPRGGRVTVTARLRAGMRPGASVLGALQVRVSGKWRPLRQLRFTARNRGRASAALRFRAPAAYRLRVRVAEQSGLRYASGVSRVRTVSVR